MKNVAVWGLQVLLPLAFGATGMMKIVTPVDQLVANGMALTTALPPIAVTLIGVAEVLGAAGLILPAATRIRPEPTPAAAAGLGVMQVAGSRVPRHAWGRDDGAGQPRACPPGLRRLRGAVEPERAGTAGQLNAYAC